MAGRGRRQELYVENCLVDSIATGVGLIAAADVRRGQQQNCGGLDEQQLSDDAIRAERLRSIYRTAGGQRSMDPSRTPLNHGHGDPAMSLANDKKVQIEQVRLLRVMILGAVLRRPPTPDAQG